MKCPYGMLAVVALVSLTVLAACWSGDRPAEENQSPATTASATTVALAPTSTSAPTFEPATPTTPVHSSSFDATKYKNVWVQAIEEIENDGRSQLRVSYPVTEREAINARTKAITQQFIDEFRVTAAEIEESYQEYKKDTGKEAASLGTIYGQDHEVTIANERVLFFEVARWTSTGNTFSTLVSSYIFDLRQGTELFISDLFVDDSYLLRVSELSREELAERLRSQIAELEPDDDDRNEPLFESRYEHIETGTEPTPENFDFIVFRDDGTVLLRFDKYQVASGAEGVVEIEFSVAEIADLLRPEIRELLGIPAETTSRRHGVATSART